MSMAKKAGNVLESIKVISFYVMDTTEGGLQPQEFFTEVEVLATTKGFKKVLTVRISSKNVLGFKPFLPTKSFQLGSVLPIKQPSLHNLLEYCVVLLSSDDSICTQKNPFFHNA